MTCPSNPSRLVYFYT